MDLQLNRKVGIFVAVIRGSCTTEKPVEPEGHVRIGKKAVVMSAGASTSRQVQASTSYCEAAWQSWSMGFSKVEAMAQITCPLRNL